MKQQFVKDIKDSGMKKFVIALIIFLIIFISIAFIRIAINNTHNIGNLVSKGAYQQAVLINDDEILITGGLDKFANYRYGSKTAQIFSIRDKKSYKIDNTNLNHLFHKMFKMQDGNIVLADTNGVEIFDIKTKKFRLLKTKPKERYQELYNYKYALLPDDLLVILGGRIKKEKQNIVDLNMGGNN